MRRLKRIIAGIAAAALVLGVNTGQSRAQETSDKPYLGLDPSTIIDNGTDVGNIPGVQAYSDSKGAVQMDGSKKGIQGIDWTSASDAGELGVKHVLLNLGLTPFLIDGDTQYNYNGKTYTFNSGYTKTFEKSVRSMNAAGITVTVVLLIQDDHNLKDWDKLVYDPQRGHSFYALNTKSQEARDTWGALFGYLSQKFGQPGCFIENWILGNEVNMPSVYNWTGTLSPAINAKICADSFVLLYNAIQGGNQAASGMPPAKAYISLDRGWRDTNGYSGIGTKDFLDRFAHDINAIQPGVDWCLAFHPYAVIMDPTCSGYTESDKLLWGNNKYTPDNVNAQFVTAANLNVLTDYVKNTYGAQHRIILSEQGFDAKGGEDYQAASLAYTFYAGQFNDMVDAVIFRSWEDHPDEMGLLLGIAGRKAEKVFKYMDTDLYAGATSVCLRTIGINNWKELVQGFDMPGMGYQDVSYDDWYLGAVKAVSQAGLMTGMNPDYFGASENLKRSHFATVLYRAQGSPGQDYLNRFTDVPNGHFYSIPVSWAAASDIVTGYENSQLFGTNDDMTREQLTVMMFRYARYKGRDTSKRADLSGFADAQNVSRFALEAMQWSVSEGIIKGEGSDGSLNPQGQVDRSVCAAVIQRFSGL